MRVERIFFLIVTAALAVSTWYNWRRAAEFQADSAKQRQQVQDLEAQAAASAKTTESSKASADKIREQTSELLRLRNELTQRRGDSKNSETLSTENQRLKAELQKLRSGAGATPVQPANDDAPPSNQGIFPRDSWSFAGYGTPDAALISAIWAMKEGDPKTYLDSLTPQEQQRMAQTWQGKSETDVAEKHKGDVAGITGVRVLERQASSAGDMVINVYLDGVGRAEKIRMQRQGNDWKFGGFIRE